MAFFTERERGAKPRTVEDVTTPVWNGIVATVRTCIDNGSFGVSYPDQCPDNNSVIGTNSELMRQAVSGYFPELHWPLRADEIPADPFIALDLVEFCYEKVGKPRAYSHHGFFGHDHLDFDIDEGRAEFLAEVNRIFSRNGVVFNLEPNGQVIRLAPAVVALALQSAIFKTGDDKLDQLLETAREKFLSHALAMRKESLEKLWDAFERLKTLEDPDKKKSIAILLAKGIGEENMRKRVEADFIELTEIGNKFMIRHTEVGKTPIENSEDVDYLFHRAFSAIRRILRGTGRGG